MSGPRCPLGFFCESGDLAFRLPPLFAIGSEIPAQLIAFQKDIQPGDHSFVDHLDGDGL